VSCQGSNPTHVYNCNLGGLPDLNTGVQHVQDSIAGYLNHLLELGVAGVRIDAAKHISPEELSTILDKVTFAFEATCMWRCCSLQAPTVCRVAGLCVGLLHFRSTQGVVLECYSCADGSFVHLHGGTACLNFNCDNGWLIVAGEGPWRVRQPRDHLDG
jgi:hypothetical protein